MRKISNKILFIILLLCISMAATSARGENTASATPIPGFIFTNNLTVGNQGGDVSALQQFLIAGGYLKIPTSTGYFGFLTKTALGAWQASVGIAPSFGFFGPLSTSTNIANP